MHARLASASAVVGAWLLASTSVARAQPPDLELTVNPEVRVVPWARRGDTALVCGGDGCMALWASGGGVFSRALDGDGRPKNAASNFLGGPRPTSTMRISEVPGGYLAAWLSDKRLVAVALDRDGKRLGRPEVVIPTMPLGPATTNSGAARLAVNGGTAAFAVTGWRPDQTFGQALVTFPVPLVAGTGKAVTFTRKTSEILSHVIATRGDGFVLFTALANALVVREVVGGSLEPGPERTISEEGCSSLGIEGDRIGCVTSAGIAMFDPAGSSQLSRFTWRMDYAVAWWDGEAFWFFRTETMGPNREHQLFRASSAGGSLAGPFVVPWAGSELTLARRPAGGLVALSSGTEHSSLGPDATFTSFLRTQTVLPTGTVGEPHSLVPSEPGRASSTCRQLVASAEGFHAILRHHPEEHQDPSVFARVVSDRGAVGPPLRLPPSGARYSVAALPGGGLAVLGLQSSSVAHLVALRPGASASEPIARIERPFGEGPSSYEGEFGVAEGPSGLLVYGKAPQRDTNLLLTRVLGLDGKLDPKVARITVAPSADWYEVVSNGRSYGVLRAEETMQAFAWSFHSLGAKGDGPAGPTVRLFDAPPPRGKLDVRHVATGADGRYLLTGAYAESQNADEKLLGIELEGDGQVVGDGPFEIVKSIGESGRPVGWAHDGRGYVFVRYRRTGFAIEWMPAERGKPFASTVLETSDPDSSLGYPCLAGLGGGRIRLVYSWFDPSPGVWAWRAFTRVLERPAEAGGAAGAGGGGAAGSGTGGTAGSDDMPSGDTRRASSGCSVSSDRAEGAALPLLFLLAALSVRARSRPGARRPPRP